jgi:putative holliday junction resolvase
VDFGWTRTGLALSDPLAVTCSPLEIIAERDEERLILRIAAVAEQRGVGEVVVGLPRPLSGGTNRQMADVLAFVERLEREMTIPVQVWDERFTWKLAVEGRPRGRAHDAVAACYILQNYLDSRAMRSGEV